MIEAAAAAGGDGRVVLIGIAQEKALVWRSWKAEGQERAAHPHMEWGRGDGVRECLDHLLITGPRHLGLVPA